MAVIAKLFSNCGYHYPLLLESIDNGHDIVEFNLKAFDLCVCEVRREWGCEVNKNKEMNSQKSEETAPLWFYLLKGMRTYFPNFF